MHPPGPRSDPPGKCPICEGHVHALGKNGLSLLLQIPTGRSFPGRHHLFGFVCVHNPAGSCGAQRAMLVRNPQPHPCLSSGALPPVTRGIVRKLFTESGRPQPSTVKWESGSWNICPFLPGKRAPLAVRVSQEDAPGEAQMAFAPLHSLSPAVPVASQPALGFPCHCDSRL